MSFALMAFGGFASLSSTGQTSVASAAATSASSTGAAIAQSGTAAIGQLVTDLQSLLSTLTGATTPSASTTSSGATTPSGSSATSTDSDSATNAGTTTATGLSNTALQELQAVAADLNTIASTSGAGGPPSWGNDISNSGTSSSDGNRHFDRWRRDYNDGAQQQFALSAYTASNNAGLASAAASSLV